MIFSKWGIMYALDPRAWDPWTTATTMNDAHTFLSARVLHDKQAVTYRLLSRAIGMHVDDAKAALERFAEAEHVSPIYTVHDLRHVFVVPANELESTLALLSDGQKQVYALQPAGTSYDPAMLASVNRALVYDEAYAAQRHAGLGAFGAIQKDDEVRAPPPPSSTCKRRKVIKRIRTKNEKGYTVFQDIETYESGDEAVSASEPAPTVPAASAAPAPSKAPSKVSPKGPSKATPKQHSLLSFFGKR